MLDSKSGLILEMQEELFLKQGQGWFRIASGSMRPLIDVDDRIFAQAVQGAEIKPRDIILFSTTEALITHRVMKIVTQNGKTRILQKGDASAFASTIASESVIGRVTTIEKKGKLCPLKDHGRTKVLNTVLGFKNCSLYRFDEKMRFLKSWLRDKPGYRYSRTVYRIAKAPFAILN